MEWIILGVILLLTAINVPIGYGLAIATILAILWTGATSLSVVPLNLFSGASSFPLLAIPLFILAGGLMETGGISQRLVNLANSLVGFIRGGLAMVTVVATMIQSEISGSSVASPIRSSTARRSASSSRTGSATSSVSASATPARCCRGGTRIRSRSRSCASTCRCRPVT